MIVGPAYAAGEALLATWIIARGGKFDFGLGTVRDVLRFCAAALAAAGATALIGAWNLTFLQHVDAHYGLAWATFFAGDALGMLALTPGLLVWGGTRVSFGGNWRRLEFGFLLCAAFAVGVLVFGQTWPTSVVLPIAYLSFPLMVWSAFRFGQPGVTAVTALLGTFALAGSAAGLGPFANALNRGEAVLVAGFMNVISITALTLAAVVQERASAQSGHRATEARFRAFMQFSPAIAFMKTADGRYVFGNDAWARQFATEATDLLGKTDSDLWPKETAAYFRESDKQTLARRGPIEVTESGPGRDGSPHWWTTLKFLVEESAVVAAAGRRHHHRHHAADAGRGSASGQRRSLSLPGRARGQRDRRRRPRWAHCRVQPRRRSVLRPEPRRCGRSRFPVPLRAGGSAVASAERLRADSRRRGRARARVGAAGGGRHAAIVPVECDPAPRRDAQCRHPDHRTGHLGTAKARGAAAAVAAHGRHRPARRRHRARLQQPADGDPGPRRNGPYRRRGKRPGAEQHRRDHEGGTASGRPDAAAAGVCAPANHRAQDRRSSIRWC